MGGTGRSANDDGRFTSEAPDGSGHARGSQTFAEAEYEESDTLATEETGATSVATANSVT